MNRPLNSNICLAMIVRDEALVIERCLTSVRPLISAWLIVDTGSRDATERVARAALAGLPGDYVSRPWRNFAHNRSECLALARARGDYSLVIDADDALEIEASALPATLHADAYTLPVLHDDVVYERTHLLRNSLPWRYEGVVHEYAVCELAGPAERLSGVRYLYLSGGVRSRESSSYRRDAELLEAALANDPDNARNVFYLAQSYRDAGLLEQAEATYLRRARMAGWGEECWYSLLEVARLRRRLERPEEMILGSYLRAYEERPSRAESVYELANYCRLRNRFDSAYLFAKLAASLPMPDDRLFVSSSVYAWRALDEWAISAYYVGRDDEAIVVAERLLRDGQLPESELARVLSNRKFSLNRAGAG